MTDPIDDFDGCSRLCAKQQKHTLKWGDCQHAVQPAPTVGVWRNFTSPDGEFGIGQMTFPLALFLPWSVHLPTADQYRMLDELGDAEPDDREPLLAAWRTTAGQLADPVRREVLLGGGIDPADFVEAERPETGHRAVHTRWTDIKAARAGSETDTKDPNP